MHYNTVNPGPNSGDFILSQLRRFGSHLDRTHEMTFWLYFPTREAAMDAARRAELSGLKSEVPTPKRKSQNSEWLCLLHCPHIPDEEILDGINQFCDDLAHDFNGKFDGWEASLELDPGEEPLI